jgi:hypothetical protein
VANETRLRVVGTVQEFRKAARLDNRNLAIHVRQFATDGRYSVRRVNCRANQHRGNDPGGIGPRHIDLWFRGPPKSAVLHILDNADNLKEAMPDGIRRTRCGC